MNKIAETLVNPVASNLAPSGKSSNTAREGISPHTVVEDDIVVCLNREKLHQNQEKPFAMSCSFPTQESWRCVSTLWLQSCIGKKEITTRGLVCFLCRDSITPTACQYISSKGSSHGRGREVAWVCLSLAFARPPRAAWWVHPTSLLTAAELKSSEVTAEARTCQINWFVEVLCNPRAAQVS